MKRSICYSSTPAVVVVLLLAWFQEITSLAIPPTAFDTSRLKQVTCRTTSAFDGFLLRNDQVKNTRGRRNQGTTRLHAGLLAPLTKAVGSVSPALRNGVLLGAAALAIAKRQQILYPGTSPDPNYSEPLPPGSFGCPFFGSNIFKNTNEGGSGEFFRRTAAKLGNARIFKYMFLGRPIVSVAGMKNVKKIYSNEFKSLQTRQLQTLFGKESLFMCKDSEDHSFQRRLVGAAMTPDSIDKAIPSLQKTVTEQIDKILQLPTVVMEDICYLYELHTRCCLETDSRT